MASYSEVIPTSPGFYVYRFWAADGTCLYVGRVGDSGPKRVQNRFYSHKSDKSWWPDVTRTEVAAFLSHEEIVAEERAQVWQLKPVHNKHYIGRGCDHDRSVPGALDADGKCVECVRQRERKRSSSPATRQRWASYQRERRRDSAARQQIAVYMRDYWRRPEVKAMQAGRKRRISRRPGPDQGALWT